MEQESVSYKTLKNISYSFVGFTFPILFSVFITPVVVRRLGIVDYGVYVLVNTITGFLGLLEFGVTSASIKYVAEYYGRDDHEQLGKVLKSGYSLYMLIGLVGMAIFFILGAFCLPLFHITGISQSNIMVVFILAGLTFLFNGISTTYIVVVQGLQRYDIYTKLNLSQLTLLNVGILVAVLLGLKLKVILALNLLAMILLSLAFFISAKKLLPKLSLRPAWDKPTIKYLYKFGILASLVTITQGSLNQLDRLLIPIFMGPAALSYYSLPGNVAQKTSTVAGSLSTVFFPLASSISGQNQHDRLGDVYRKIIRNITVLAAGIATAIMAFGYQILQYWLSRDLADRGTRILLILAVTYFILAVYSTLQNFLMGMGRIKLLAAASTVMAILNLALILLLMPRYGIEGAAWAYLIGVVPMFWLFYWVESRILKLSKVGRFYAKLFSKILLTSALFFIFAKFVLVPAVVGFKSLLVIGPLSVLLYYVIYWLFGFFEKEDILLLKSFFDKIVERVRAVFVQQANGN